MKNARKCILTVLSGIIILAIVYFPARHARHYTFIDIPYIYNELVFTSDKTYISSQIENCTYQDVLLNNSDIVTEHLFAYKEYIRPKFGGEYVPVECNALLKSAIIVPYRNRKDQLVIFLNYMHHFLQKQNLHYRIFIVEQNDTLPFNRAKMLNYGAKVAMNLNYSCLILHDVDLIPINTGNIYACSRRPRHMSSSLDTFRYNLPYLTLFGGAIAIQAKHFQIVNGMSNLYFGWGGEDDDFYNRLEAHDLVPYRFSPRINKYIMLVHKKMQPSSERFLNLKSSIERHLMDGLNSLSNNYEVHLRSFFTHVVVS